MPLFKSTGNVTIELLKREQTVFALDNSEMFLGVLKEKCKLYSKNLRVVFSDASSTPFENSVFDAVSSMFVTYYLADIQKYISGVYRVLKDGGIFVVAMRFVF